MAVRQDEGDSDLGGYLGSFFGGSGSSTPKYGITDPPVRVQGPEIPPSGGNTGGMNLNPTNLAPTPDWLQQTLNSGVSADEAAKTYNSVFGRTSGNEAVVYPNTNGGGYTTVGVPEGYFTQEGGQQIGPGLTSWGFTQRGPETGGGGGGGATTGLVAGGGQGSGTGFADPAYQQLNDLAQRRISSLQQPTQFPQLDAYMQMLQQQQAAAKQRAQVFADQLTGRIKELQSPLLSQGDVATQNALASNNLLAQRDAMLKNSKESLYARGFEPSSGLQEGSNRSINEAYQNRQGNIDAQLRSQAIAQDEQRRNQATQLQGLVQQALAGGDVSALQAAATQSDLENQLFNIGQNREREQLTTANIPVDLTNMGFANALNASNSNQNPLSAIFSLIGAGQQGQQLQQNQTNSNMNGLAWLLQSVLR